jgi:GTPase SAR1 family protein
VRRIDIVYDGPGLAGKTTSMTCVHAHFAPERRTVLETVYQPDSARLLRFTARPAEPEVAVHVTGVVGAVYSPAVTREVLDLADGIVLVVDSQRERLEANLYRLEMITAALAGDGRGDVAIVLAYNKRDLPNAMPIAELERALNPSGRRFFETCAPRGEGVVAAFEACLRALV